MSFKKIEHCRLCKQSTLAVVFDLGIHPLSSRFPKKGESVPSAPLILVICETCGMVQLSHDYHLDDLYRNDYGYRSGINQTMLTHLAGIARQVERIADLSSGDVILDIGSNDATLLNAYQVEGVRRFGIDPTYAQYKKYYPDSITATDDYFSASAFSNLSADKAKVITSIAIFYDLPDPTAFVRDIASCLKSDGVWVFEQLYLGSMLEMNAFDAICHEHLEFYSLSIIVRILESCGLRVFNVELNTANGGSLRVFACHADAPYPTTYEVTRLLADEEKNGLLTAAPLIAFRDRSLAIRDQLRDLIIGLNNEGKKLYLYGASTKGNTLLNFCGLSSAEIKGAADRNPQKWGRYTPGTWIQIFDEATVRAAHPDYFLVLPWHFKTEFLEREKSYLDNGGNMIFPLPEISVV